jgi:Ca2+-binding RTX toxin-like protein
MRRRVLVACLLLTVAVVSPPGAGAADPTCDGKPVTRFVPAGGDRFNGTSGPDVIQGTPGPDLIFGLGGNDTICGLGGDDVLLGGPGDDVLLGGDGKDKLRGAAGDDVLDGGGGSDRLLPETGDDVVGGGPGSDIVDYLAADGPVVVDLAAGTATYSPPGGVWNHTLVLIEKVDGSAYDDTISGDGKRNVLRGKQGADVLTGGDGDDDLIGGTGDDALSGEAGDDLLKGQAEDDTLSGGDGDDRIVGGNGNDVLRGDAGADDLRGGLRSHLGTYANSMDGGPGIDTCRWEHDGPVDCNEPPMKSASFVAGDPQSTIAIDRGGDRDYRSVVVDGVAAVRSGDGEALPSPDGNLVVDFYLQFRVTDNLIFRAQPTSRILVEVEYLDTGTDSFNLQYDAVGGPFKDTHVITKAGTGTFRTATLSLCDAFFANRDGGADLRIADGNDGAETIRRVTVTLREPDRETIRVDSCGADPFDDDPDSEAIQACLDRACEGDTVLFTSGAGDPGYRGYRVDRTLFLRRFEPQGGITFTSTNPDDHALLAAAADLAGPVVRLFARSAIRHAGEIDDITFASIDVDGNRAERQCNGSDGSGDGVDDNWGSWLPECDVHGDPWCSPTGLGMHGAVDLGDPTQDYAANPERWSTGIVVRDVVVSNVECGTGLAFGSAAGVIDSVTIDTAGDHVHVPGCAATDPDEAMGSWSDGMTIYGPAHRITGNTVRDASDIGIVTFGGRDTVISGNTIIATPGNHGMFAGIALHPYRFGLSSGFEVTGNDVVNQGDSVCGGIHTGIDIGAHMWRAGCDGLASPSAYGTPGACTSVSPAPGGTLCTAGQPCRVWAYVPAGTSFALTDNTVTGAQVNFLVEGLEVDGSLVTSGNSSVAPRMTDWESDSGCFHDGIEDSWTTADFVAHDPTLSGWEDRRIYCER